MSMAFAVGKRKCADGRTRLVVVDGAQAGEGFEPVVQSDAAGRLEPLSQPEAPSTGVELSLEELAALGVQVGYRLADDAVELAFYRAPECVATGAPTAQGASQAESALQSIPVPQADSWAGFSDNERTVCELIRERGEVNALEATNAIGMTPRGGIRLLTGLVHRGVLTYEGSGTKKKYHLADK